MAQALATMLILLAFAAPASAATVDQASTIADAAWPGSPCAGQETVVSTDALVNGDGAVGEALVRWIWDGQAWRIVPDANYCTVRVRTNLDPYDLCVTLVHEFGHLAGYTHDDSAVNDGIMASDAATWEPCEAVDNQETPREFAAETVNVSPRRCHLDDARTRSQTFLCRARLVRVRLDNHGEPQWAQLLRKH